MVELILLSVFWVLKMVWSPTYACTWVISNHHGHFASNWCVMKYSTYFSIIIGFWIYLVSFAQTWWMYLHLGQVNRSKTTIQISNHINMQYAKELYTVSCSRPLMIDGPSIGPSPLLGYITTTGAFGIQNLCIISVNQTTKRPMLPL